MARAGDRLSVGPRPIARITFRLREFVIPEGVDPASRMPTGYKGSKPFLAANTNREFPGYDLNITDQRRADVFLAEFARFVRTGAMPKLIVMRLPNDHTAGARANAPTPLAYMADNDLALGRVVEAISRSQFGAAPRSSSSMTTCRTGPITSPPTDAFLPRLSWAVPACTTASQHHRRIATIEESWDWPPAVDYKGTLRYVGTESPDIAPYRALLPHSSRSRNRPGTWCPRVPAARSCLQACGGGYLNQILWRAIQGESVPYPGPTRMSALEWKRAK